MRCSGLSQSQRGVRAKNLSRAWCEISKNGLISILKDKQNEKYLINNFLFEMFSLQRKINLCRSYGQRYCQFDASNQFYSLNELHSLVNKIKLNHKNNERIFNGGNLVEAYREYHANFGNKGITDKLILEQLVMVFSNEDKELCKLAWQGFFENNELPSEVCTIAYLRAFKDDVSAEEVTYISFFS